MEMKKKSDPLVAASNVYKLINENDRMRVLRVTFRPGDTAKMHYHPQHVVYVLKGGTVNLTTGGKTQQMDLQEGKAVFLDAQDHEVSNVDKSVVDLLVVELK